MRGPAGGTQPGERLAHHRFAARPVPVCLGMGRRTLSCPRRVQTRYQRVDFGEHAFGRHRPALGVWRGATLVAMSQPTRRPLVELLTRDGCTLCARVHARLAELADELGFDLSTTDVDAVASAGNPGLRAEFGDRLPVILLDGREHSYWEIDEPRLRADLAR